MIVIDASAAFDLLTRNEDTPRIELRLLRAGIKMHAPEIFRVELLSILRGRERLMDSPERVSAVFEAIRVFPVTLYPHDALLPRAFQLRNNFSAYDALYVALAEFLDAPLLTRDRRLAAPSKAHKARIEVI